MVRVMAGEGAGGLGVTGSGCCDLLGYFWVLISDTSLYPLLGARPKSLRLPSWLAEPASITSPQSGLCLPLSPSVPRSYSLGLPTRSPCDWGPLCYLSPAAGLEGWACRPG